MCLQAASRFSRSRAASAVFAPSRARVRANRQAYSAAGADNQCDAIPELKIHRLASSIHCAVNSRYRVNAPAMVVVRGAGSLQDVRPEYPASPISRMALCKLGRTSTKRAPWCRHARDPSHAH